MTRTQHQGYLFRISSLCYCLKPINTGLLVFQGCIKADISISLVNFEEIIIINTISEHPSVYVGRVIGAGAGEYIILPRDRDIGCCPHDIRQPDQPTCRLFQWLGNIATLHCFERWQEEPHICAPYGR